jgi:hypothetical protein
MRSIAQATIWEYTRRARFTFVATLLAALLLPTIAYSYVMTGIDVGERMLASWEFAFTLLAVVAFNLAVLSMQGTMPAVGLGEGPWRLYTLPVSTWRLALDQMVCGMAMITLLYLATAIPINLVFDARWPLAGPAAFAAMSYACLQATAWLTLRWGLLKLVAAMPPSLLLFCWYKGHFGELTADIEHSFTPLRPIEVIAMLLITLLAVGVGITAVARDRRGDLQGWLAARDWLNRISGNRPGRQFQFAGYGRAQMWCEWREKGWLIPAGFIAVLVILAAFHLFISRSLVDTLRELPAGIFTAAIGVSLVAALTMGHLDLPRGRLECSTFLGTRPISDAALAAATLKTTLAGLSLVWVLWPLALAAAWLLLRTLAVDIVVSDFRHNIGRDARNALAVYVLTGLCSWIAPAVLVPIGLTGRKPLLMGALCCLPAAILVWTMMVQVWLPPPIAGMMRTASVYVISAAMIAGTAVAFWRSSRAAKNLVSLPMAMTLWLALCALAAGCLWDVGAFWGMLTLFAGLSALAVSPLATAPLAVAWNRHR